MFLTKNNHIYKIPSPKNYRYKAIAELSNQEILYVLIYYSTINRKPSEVLEVSFDRIQLALEGQYEYTNNEMDMHLYNFNNYAYMDAKRLAEKEIIPLPKALITPKDIEKQALYQYIKEKYPVLMKSLPLMIEKHIKKCSCIDQEHRKLVRDALAIKNRVKNI
ncbi:hypothetical protein [Cellulosilyticum sp. I15G10I2]|uniref:hypothetical protein n=1 Tax=Cellulosilyticum sp. I15G10I2 TaxID=1892843 RepID=UPI00114CB1FD|nr:hypothetical protein [Cellulosilyticum sp. I15G10I2]